MMVVIKTLTFIANLCTHIQLISLMSPTWSTLALGNGINSSIIDDIVLTYCKTYGMCNVVCGKQPNTGCVIHYEHSLISPSFMKGCSIGLGCYIVKDYTDIIISDELVIR